MVRIMAVVTIAILLLLIANCCYCSSAQSVLNVAPGIFSKKTESNGLTLPATSTFKPITALTTNIHIAKPYSVFVHYQITFGTGNAAFYSKLLINYANAGSLVHSGNQQYKTATGFYMANLNPGYYTFEVHYKSPVAINMGANLSWQTAILQVMWFEDAHAVSDGIKCYPTPITTNTYDIWGPVMDIKTVLFLPNKRAAISAYQFSTEMSSPYYVVTALNVNGFHQHSTSFLKGNNAFLDLHGAWAGNGYAGLYYFGIQYRTPTALSFTDCKEKHKNNQNLYAMMLPPSCKVTTVQPKTSFSLGGSNSWASSDVTYSFTLSRISHVIIMYQYAGHGGNSHVVMRLSIDSVVQKHTVSLTGDTAYAGNFGLWQGSLNNGAHKITLDYRTPRATTNGISPNLDWQQVYAHRIWQNRALTIIIC